ncbi:MAG: phosphonopyruvate decarboxylase [Pseudomonadota bacterium]|nr:phosphonopyruvate decarboxylase [Pseudomonadota bacterium]
MIAAQDFVDVARAAGYTSYAGVPCSFLTPFINFVINDKRLRYISSANEGDAVATASGAAVGGQRSTVMIQNSGLGNTVSPLTSLNYVFRIPLLLICTHRGAPDLRDEPQHELMGRITGSVLETMEIPWEPFPIESGAIRAALDRARAFIECEERPYAFVMRGGTVAAHALDPERRPPRATAPGKHVEMVKEQPRPSRSEVLHRVLECTPVEGTVIIATTGYTGRELYALADRPNQLYMVGSMGCASSFGLGVALARPDLRVVILDGDGAALMRMGNLATIGAYGGPNLIHIVLDNEVHDSTGAQATVSAGVSFAKIAQACGYGSSFAGDQTDVIEALFDAVPEGKPLFCHVKIRTGALPVLPRPAAAPSEVVRRLMSHIGSRF